MKVISEVYMHVRPLYMDDWLSTTFVENDNSSEFEVRTAPPPTGRGEGGPRCPDFRPSQEEERQMERKLREWNAIRYRSADPTNGSAIELSSFVRAYMMSLTSICGPRFTEGPQDQPPSQDADEGVVGADWLDHYFLHDALFTNYT